MSIFKLLKQEFLQTLVKPEPILDIDKANCLRQASAFWTPPGETNDL